MKSVLKILLGIILLCIAAQLNLEFSEKLAALSISMISMAVLLLPFYLNKIESLATVLGYIFLAIAGLPVMSSGLTGKNLLFSPTFGYILGFVIAVLIISIIEKRQDSFWMIVIWFFLGHGIILSFGVPYYYHFGENVNIGQLVWPFMPGLLFKSLLGAGIISWTRRRFYKAVN